jgi:hypothetical protein
MTDGDKIAAAILASAADRTLTATRFNTTLLQDLYGHFLRIVAETGTRIPQQRMGDPIWLAERQRSSGD